MNESLGMHDIWRSNVDPLYAQDYARANSEAAAYMWEAAYSGSGSDYNYSIQQSQIWLNKAMKLFQNNERH